MFKLAEPSVIVLDELVMFARQLPDDRFEALLSFMQSLTEAAKKGPSRPWSSDYCASDWHAQFTGVDELMLSSRLGQNLLIFR
jgi:hypothetical protein